MVALHQGGLEPGALIHQPVLRIPSRSKNCAPVKPRYRFWVTGQDEYLQPLPGLFQYPCHTGKAPGVCRNEHVVEDYELALVFGEHVGQREVLSS